MLMTRGTRDGLSDRFRTLLELYDLDFSATEYIIIYLKESPF